MYSKQVVKEGLFGNRIRPGINRKRETRHRVVFGSDQIYKYTGLDRDRQNVAKQTKTRQIQDVTRI